MDPTTSTTPSTLPIGLGTSNKEAQVTAFIPVITANGPMQIPTLIPMNIVQTTLFNPLGITTTAPRPFDAGVATGVAEVLSTTSGGSQKGKSRGKRGTYTRPKNALLSALHMLQHEDLLKCKLDLETLDEKKMVHYVKIVPDPNICIRVFAVLSTAVRMGVGKCKKKNCAFCHNREASRFQMCECLRTLMGSRLGLKSEILSCTGRNMWQQCYFFSGPAFSGKIED